MGKDGRVALSGMVAAPSVILYLFREMPCVALRTLINAKVTAAPHADKGVSPGLCTLLVKANLPADALRSMWIPVGTETCIGNAHSHFALIARTPSVAILVLERLESC